MINIDSQRDRINDVIETDGNSDASARTPNYPREIAAVSLCLTQQHEECRGGYNDFSNSYFIRCDCQCHRLSYEKDQKRLVQNSNKAKNAQETEQKEEVKCGKGCEPSIHTVNHQLKNQILGREVGRRT